MIWGFLKEGVKIYLTTPGSPLDSPTFFSVRASTVYQYRRYWAIFHDPRQSEPLALNLCYFIFPSSQEEPSEETIGSLEPYTRLLDQLPALLESLVFSVSEDRAASRSVRTSVSPSSTWSDRHQRSLNRSLRIAFDLFEILSEVSQAPY